MKKLEFLVKNKKVCIINDGCGIWCNKSKNWVIHQMSQDLYSFHIWRHARLVLVMISGHY